MFFSIALVLLLISNSGVHVDAQFAASAMWYSGTTFNYFSLKLVVPPIPSSTAWQDLFIWPGLQPADGGANFYPINNGVLQPVLTYGYSCAPNPNYLDVDTTTTWWISAQYVNTYGSEPGYSGCYGGDRMAVSPGDTLSIVMGILPGTTIWRQTVTSAWTGQEIWFDMNMRGQAQGWAELVIEYYGSWLSPPPQIYYKDIIIFANASDPAFCDYTPTVEPLPGASVWCSQPVIRQNMCTISECIFN